MHCAFECFFISLMYNADMEFSERKREREWEERELCFMFYIVIIGIYMYNWIILWSRLSIKNVVTQIEPHQTETDDVKMIFLGWGGEKGENA